MTLSETSSPFELVPIGKLIKLESDSQLLEDLIAMLAGKDYMKLETWSDKPNLMMFNPNGPMMKMPLGKGETPREAIASAVNHWKEKK